MIGLKDGGVLTSTFNFMREDVFKKNLSDDIEIVKCEHPCEADKVANRIMKEVRKNFAKELKNPNTNLYTLKTKEASVKIQ